MSESSRARPVSLAERIATTALVPVLVVLAGRIPLSHVDAARLARTRFYASPLDVGLVPFITAYVLVELAALTIPRWRRARHDARGRVRLERWSTGLAVALAFVQALGIAWMLQSSGVVSVLGWETIAVHTATLTGGACALALAARWVTRRGLINGYVLGCALPVAIGLARGDAFRQASLRGGGQDVALLAIALGVAVAATVLVLAGGDAPSAAARFASAYRGGGTDAPSPAFPIPLSSVQPIPFAASVLAVPAVLASLGVPTMAALEGALARHGLAFEALSAAVVAVAMLVAVALLYRPDDVSALMRRLGSAPDPTARAATRSAVRRALPPTLAYLLTLLIATTAAHDKARAVPEAVAIAIATGAVLDLARSAVAHVRARDLVCVTVLHDAYAVAPLRAALQAEGIDARARGMAVLSLLQAFGSYAPAELYVGAADAERASALLRHWAAGETKPATPEAEVGVSSGPAPGARAPWSAGRRALALAALGGLALLDQLAPRIPGGLAKRAEIAVFRVDDDDDPLRARPCNGVHCEGLREDEAPEGVTVAEQVVPRGEQRKDARSFARVALREGESLQAAWARVRPWLDGVPLAAGDRWAWEPVTEPDGDLDDEEGMPTSLRVTGLRTIVLAGDPVLTTADVVSAEVVTDDPGTGRPTVIVTLSPAARERFHRLTEEWLGRRLAIVIDDHVDSAPVVASPIPGGRVSITLGVGTRDQQLADAYHLAASLR